MHSAEHLLNRTMVNLFETGRCFSAHIEKKKSKCDYRFDRNLTQAEIERIENRINQAIDADLPVKEVWIDKDKAVQHFDLGRLPGDGSEAIRIVRIGDYDACPCIGPHVTSTGRIGAFRITSVSHEDSVLRIRFKLSAPAVT